MKPAQAPEEFDHYAESYEQVLGDALKVSGEDREYFARRRVEWLGECLKAEGERATSLLDYGCGDGSTTTLLAAILSAKRSIGVDTSSKSLDVARQKYGSSRLQFAAIGEHSPDASVDIAYCNGVFHHIPPAERQGCVRFVRDSLRPGGFFSFWENNPWNPGTRYVMSQCAFDRDAITLTPLEAKSLLRAGGFHVERTDFLFFFPRALKVLRPFEKFLMGVPLGAQYHILCRRLASGS